MSPTILFIPGFWEVEAVIAEGVQVVLVAHSGGGFLGSNAIEGLSAKARTESGLNGVVVGIVFLTAALFPEGFKHQPLPFAESKGGAMYCANPKSTFFGDLDEAIANEWVGKLKCQPAYGWDDTITFCGWKEVPSVYLICEGDQAIPAAVQLQMAESAGSKIERCSAGHMVILSMPEKAAAVIEAAVASF
ncbi:MAG: hypothetical protein L6R37_003497 [Teloschistes peruensis]|nr:MAG: hypothetical protein L6R37_003497 [Teloschistes peruensis]